MSNAFKVFLFAIVGLVVVVLSVVGITTTTEGQKMANSGTAQVKNVAKNFSSVELTVYDGRPTSGSVVVELVNQLLEDKPELSIWVKTKANGSTGAYYNKSMNTSSPYKFTTTPTPMPSIPTSLTSNDYINPDAQFMGKIYKDENDNIICIGFTQMN